MSNMSEEVIFTLHCHSFTIFLCLGSYRFLLWVACGAETKLSLPHVCFILSKACVWNASHVWGVKSTRQTPVLLRSDSLIGCCLWWTNDDYWESSVIHSDSSGLNVFFSKRGSPKRTHWPGPLCTLIHQLLQRLRGWREKKVSSLRLQEAVFSI